MMMMTILRIWRREGEEGRGKRRRAAISNKPWANSGYLSDRDRVLMEAKRTASLQKSLW